MHFRVVLFTARRGGVCRRRRPLTNRNSRMQNVNRRADDMRHLFLRFVVLADVVGFEIFGGTKQKLAYALIEPSSCPRAQLLWHQNRGRVPKITPSQS